MPLFLDDVDFSNEIEGLGSAIIVPCRTCPATSLAVREKVPIFNLFRHFLNSPPLTQHLSNIQNGLEEKGLKTDVFLSRQPLACAWSARERRRLVKRARDYDAAIVLGCDSTIATVQDALQDIECRVIKGMKFAGIVNVKVNIQLSGKVTLQDVKIISVFENTTGKTIPQPP